MKELIEELKLLIETLCPDPDCSEKNFKICIMCICDDDLYKLYKKLFK